MGANDAREQLATCKEVTVRQERVIRLAIEQLENIHNSYPRAVALAIEILQEGLK